MSPRARPSRLLLALAGTAGLGSAVAWWFVPEGSEHSVAEPWREVAARAAPAESAALVDLPAAVVRTSSATAAVEDSPCLEEGYTSISGVVVDSDRTPIAGADVAILGAPHEPDALRVRGQARTDELGRFDVRTPRAGDVWVVAFSPGLRPVSRGLAIEPGFVDLAQPLQLERGVAITGRVLADDAPLARVELEVLGPRHARRVPIGEHELALTGGRLEWGAARCATGADGSWSFRGLAPGRWLVRPRAFRCPGAVFPPGALAAEAIDAPATGVDLRIPAARLAVDVLEIGRAHV